MSVSVEAKQQWVRRCKRSSSFLDMTKKAKENNHGCSKNVWLAMDRASKCPQLNGASDSVPIIEASVQPRLYGRSGLYSANCEYMVTVFYDYFPNVHFTGYCGAKERLYSFADRRDSVQVS
uniref:Uncharacterized protein n=1 Tax=Caenorhabditis japonica TaxID=281687 RepID=A0A8R1DZH1_CAEJA